MQANYIHDYLYIQFSQCYTVQPSEQVLDKENVSAAYCVMRARIARVQQQVQHNATKTLRSCTLR
eukprot:17574-Heterococcus_DN1.PRE.5